MGSYKPPVTKEKPFPSFEPNTVFFGCVDGRIPMGQLGFRLDKLVMHRNIAALIRKDDLGIRAALEFGIKAKNIHRIVVGAHTDCGGVGACVEQRHDLPAVLEYMQPMESDRLKVIKEFPGDVTAQKREMENRVVKRGLENLRSYDFVREAEARGDLVLEGMLIDIRDHSRHKLDEHSGQFIPMPPITLSESMHVRRH